MDRNKKNILLKKIGLGLAGFSLSFAAFIALIRMDYKKKIRIQSENGIQECGFKSIGGIMQYFQIRGEDVRNPVILFLHGGPGSPHSFVSHHYQRELEKDYTFVNWDQPGSGRTFYANQERFRTDKITVDEILRDLDEVVDYIRNRLHQDKIIIMGHSWGSVIGSIYIQEHPEKIRAYIGQGQVIDPTGEEKAVHEAMRQAHKDGNEKYIKELGLLFDDFNKAKDIGEINEKQLLRIRKVAAAYLSEEEVRKGREMLWMGISSPEMNKEDFRWYKKILIESRDFADIQRNLVDFLFFKFDIRELSKKYEVPIYYISGTSDWITPFVAVEEYIEEIEAPDKKFVFVKGAGHNAHVDNPKAFAKAVRSLLNRTKKDAGEE